ncbi:MAG: hypothetical protein ACK5IC_03995 [Moheibacter sp.]
METLILTKEQKAQIQGYRRLGIEIELLDDESVLISQKQLKNGYILNQKQLHERAKEVFPDKHIIPNVFSLGVDDITIDWIQAKMLEFGIKRNDFVNQLALTKSYISLLFTNKNNDRKINLSKPMKAMFFYYFLTYELNRDFRES